MISTLSAPTVDDHAVDDTSENAAGERHPVEVFGIRHHGPGSARSLVAALRDYQPDAVLIEGPADADPLLRWVLADEMTPPLALLGYAPDHPQTAAFWPYAVFSPEWQAMIYARQRDIDVGFCDLPASTMLARWPRRPTLDDDLEESDDVPSESLSGPLVDQQDPLAALAAAAGYDDPERWWDDLVEARLDSSSPFPLITDAMAELRMIMDQHGRDAEREARREAYMRQKIRETLKRGRERVAVVCGAWHAPVLRWPLPPAASRRPHVAGSASTQDHIDLGALDSSAACLGNRLRRRRRLAWLVPPPLDSSRSADCALACQSRAGLTCPGPSGVQRSRHRGCPARGNLGRLAWQTVGWSGGGHRGDSGSAL